MKQRQDSPPVSHFLGLAIKEYNSARYLMQEFKICFPYRIFGPNEAKYPEKGVQILIKVHDHIQITIKHLEDAYSLW